MLTGSDRLFTIASMLSLVPLLLPLAISPIKSAGLASLSLSQHIYTYVHNIFSKKALAAATRSKLFFFLGAVY